MVEPAGRPPLVPPEYPGGLPVDVAELPVPGPLVVVEAVPGLLAGGLEPVPGLGVGDLEPVPGLGVGHLEPVPRLIAGGLEPVPGLGVSDLEPVPGLIAGRLERFGAGLAAPAPFGDDRGTDQRLARAGHCLASCRQTMYVPRGELSVP
jgi:hypothetical protein